MDKLRLFIILPFFLFTAGSSQTKHVLTLEQSIDVALRQGYAVRNATSQYLSSKKGYESALRGLRTSVALTLDTPSFSESLTNQFNPLTQVYEFYQLKTTRYQGGLTISQPLVFTGGTLTLRESLFRRDQVSGPAGFSRTGRDYFNNFLIEFRQPLFTPNLLRLSADRASLGLQQAETEFLKNQLDVIFTVTEAFYTLYQLSERLEISREQVRQNEESFRTAKTKFEAGLIPEVEVLQSDVDLVTSQNELLNAQREHARARNTFCLLLGWPLTDEVEPVADLSYTPVAIDEEAAIGSALKNRAEVAGAERNVELKLLDITQAESRNDFRLDVTATYGFNRNDSELDRVFRDFGTTRSATLTLSVPLFDWGSKSLEVEAAKIQYNNAIDTYAYIRQQVRQEIKDLISRIRVAESRIRVLEKVVAVAQKGYEISLERFRAGTINRNDLAQAQQRLTTAKISNLSALIDYRIGLADLKRKTLFDFERNEPMRVREGE